MSGSKAETKLTLDACAMSDATQNFRFSELFGFQSFSDFGVTDNGLWICAGTVKTHKLVD